MYDQATARKMLEEATEFSEDSCYSRGDYHYFYSDADKPCPETPFDPDDMALDNTYRCVIGSSSFAREITPVIYSARIGDLKMCRYLVSRGASTTKTTDTWSPMYAAAFGTYKIIPDEETYKLQGHLEVCKFLHANGARHDVRKEMYSNGWTPFHAATYQGHDELVRWLVLQGALCVDDSSEAIEGDRIYPKRCGGRARNTMSPSCLRLVEWAKEVTQTHSELVTFLLGTLPPAPDKDQSCTLQCLSGHPGVRKHIGDFVGRLEVTNEKQLRILRNVVDVLPSFIRTGSWANYLPIDQLMTTTCT